MLTGYPEPMVARVAGVPKGRLVEIRKGQLTRDVDWELRGAVVHYTKPGLERLLPLAGIDIAAFVWPMDLRQGIRPPSPTSASQGEATAPQPEAMPRTVPAAPPTPARPLVARPGAAQIVAEKVAEKIADLQARPLVQVMVHALSRNPGILYAALPSGVRVMVRVRRNLHFRAGMCLDARPSRTDGLYFHVGRCPPRPPRPGRH